MLQCVVQPEQATSVPCYNAALRYDAALLCLLHVCGPVTAVPRPACSTPQAMVVCDSYWCDAEPARDGSPDSDSGLPLLSQAEMLSLDSSVLMVQLNIRLLLEVRVFEAGAEAGRGAAILGSVPPCLASVPWQSTALHLHTHRRRWATPPYPSSVRS